MSEWLAQATPGVRQLHPYQPGKPIESLQRELGLSEVVKLASNENPLGPSPNALAAAQEALGDLGRYPDGGGYELKAALAHQLAVSPEQLTLGNGSNDVLELVARAFVSAEDEVIYSRHSFAVYALVTQAIGAQAVVVEEQDFVLDLSALLAAVTPRTKVIFIANPNNPTGTYVEAAQLHRFMQQVPEQVLVVLDEAYCEYIQQADYPDGLAMLPQYPNLIVTRTFSKAYGLAGLRVGYSVSHPELAEILNRVRQPFNVNSVALAAATAALADTAHLARSRELNQAGLVQWQQGLTVLGLSFIPSVANFITLDLQQPALPVYQALLQQGVIVRPVVNYGMPQHLRISVGLADENQRALAALAQVLAL